jgi:hypothetical protein
MCPDDDAIGFLAEKPVCVAVLGIGINLARMAAGHGHSGPEK